MSDEATVISVCCQGSALALYNTLNNALHKSLSTALHDTLHNELFTTHNAIPYTIQLTVVHNIQPRLHPYYPGPQSAVRETAIS